MINIKSFDIKLLDFGISCKDPNISDKINKCSNCIGTFLYMAPELYICNVTQWQKTDIWSIGVIFYQLLTGVFPSIYNGDNWIYISKNVFNYIKQKQEIKLNFLKDGLTDEQNNVINILVENLLHINPEDRPTIDNFIIEISKIRILYNRIYQSIPIIYPPKTTIIASEQKVDNSLQPQSQQPQPQLVYSPSMTESQKLDASDRAIKSPFVYTPSITKSQKLDASDRAIKSQSKLQSGGFLKSVYRDLKYKFC
jgi:serine/threonine protein kinase